MLVLTLVLGCGGGSPSADARAPAREPGELFLPPSATAPRVMREAAPPDTFQPDTSGEFAILGRDTLEAPALGVDAIEASYRANYTAALQAEGSAVRNRIDRDLQREAELRTARERGFADWIEMVGALTPEQRARLVGRLDAANVDLAHDLHGTEGPAEADDTAPEG